MTGNDQIIVNQCCGQLVNCSNESFVSANELIEHFENIFIVTIVEIYNAIHRKVPVPSLVFANLNVKQNVREFKEF